MTTFAHSQAQGSLPMEFPSMSSQAGSLAKTFQSQESSVAWAKEPVPAFGLKSSVLLASYDPDTSSWRTSQHCLLAQTLRLADGLAEFSETWPSAGMMRNGKTYQRQPWALPTVANVSGLLPTPNARDYKDLSRTTAFLAARDRHSPSLSTLALTAGVAWQNVAPLYEMAMGFPPQWTDVA
jgi:hypothetical protein